MSIKTSIKTKSGHRFELHTDIHHLNLDVLHKNVLTIGTLGVYQSDIFYNEKVEVPHDASSEEIQAVKEKHEQGAIEAFGRIIEVPFLGNEPFDLKEAVASNEVAIVVPVSKWNKMVAKVKSWGIWSKLSNIKAKIRSWKVWRFFSKSRG